MDKTNIKSEVEVKINKEDIFLLLIGEEENKITNEIAKIDFRLKNAIARKETLKKKIEDRIIKKHTTGDIKDITFYRSIFSTVDDPRNICYYNYNIEDLSQLRNPMASKKNKVYVRISSVELETEVILNKKIVDDGFSGKITKRVSILGMKFTADLKEYNDTIFKIAEYEKEINNLEYKKLCLPFDKTIKANFIKKIINKKDVKALLK